MQSELCLHQIFAQQAALRPGAPAVCDTAEELTYRQLDERAARLAAVILREVAGPGARVGLHLARGNAVVVAILATLKAGCAYVPLDPAYPAERVQYMADDASVDLVLTDADPAAGGSTVPAAKRVVTIDPGLWADDAPRADEVEVSPQAPAYVIYTSGSSGTPKGVEVSHANVTALLAAFDQLLETDSSDVWTLFHSYCFDFSVGELWGALAHGAKLVVVPAQAARSPEAMLDLLAAEQVTVLNQVTSAFRYLSRAATAAGSTAGAKAAQALRYVIFGGEVADIDAVREWRQVLGTNTAFVNVYGITETTVFATGRQLLPAEIDVPIGSPAPAGSADPALNIGPPLDGFELAVLTPEGDLTEPGEIGEIYLAGPQLAIGYLNRPELDAERYPVLALPGQEPRRYYRSGDLVMLRADGALEYAGRADDQVKINGYRIEIGEVETALRATPGIGDLVVVPTTSRVGEKMLVAFYTAPDGGAPDAGLAERLTGHARAALPAFMVPGRFVHVPELPLSPAGKTDKRALAARLR
ncbi:amino acid adenylation domain-containing protein [Kitasatospora sp. NBC_01250]|uniref:amino acid adenylation domain-containing protein n=1 Tax=Kitasatospora sp. NBC_01250 TaxID=2903571 RepID=UPI002E319174|nr:amino acid adenylation domain-containing protein [Kitasatospora sp. NBC_01250]